jgi:hypothetical protein
LVSAPETDMQEKRSCSKRLIGSCQHTIAMLLRLTCGFLVELVSEWLARGEMHM